MRRMTFWKTFWASFLAITTASFVVVGSFFLLVGIVVSGVGEVLQPKALEVEENTVLHMQLDGTLGDYTTADFDSDRFRLSKQFGLLDIQKGLEIAKEDDKVKGIFLHCDGLATGMATTKEIREALLDFQSSGKFIIAYHEYYSTKAYYLSSVADQLYVFPSGMLGWLGLGAERMFLRGTLEKLDVEMQIVRGPDNQFKSAVEPLTRDRMSEASRLQVQRILDVVWEETVEAVAASRKLTPDRLNDIADSLLVRQSGDAVRYRMADGSLYYDEVLDTLSRRAGTRDKEELALLSFKKYALKKAKKARTAEKIDDKNIALIFASGEIVDGEGTADQIGGSSLSEAIREAREDEAIKAIVLRVNSPGGSALASDMIWHEVMAAKAAGKPVVASMGDVAASGGYYIACAADKIYAQSNTITGSIGVFGVIPYTGKMFKNKLGITFDRVQTNPHAVFSTNRKLDEEEYRTVQMVVDTIYRDFVAKVASGRSMTPSAVDNIAKGRVWIGADAKKNGLVDAHGGLQDAIADAAQKAGIAADSVAVHVYPEQEDDQLFEWLESVEEEWGARVHSRGVTPLESQLRAIYDHLSALSSVTTHHNCVQARLPYTIWIE